MRLCVFCGASPGRTPAYAALAREVGTGLAARGIGIVYGGGRVGLMGALADAALAAGGEVVGVIPRRLVDRELAHPGLTELDVVDTLHERKARMAELADGFIALPGGLGTLEELAEVASWAQLELHRKPIGLLGPGRLLGRAAGLAGPRRGGWVHLAGPPDARGGRCRPGRAPRALRPLGAARPALGSERGRLRAGGRLARHGRWRAEGYGRSGSPSGPSSASVGVGRGRPWDGLHAGRREQPGGHRPDRRRGRGPASRRSGC